MNICMLEAGVPPVQHLMKKKRFNFIQRKQVHIDMDEPHHFVYTLCREAHTPGFRFIERSAIWESDTNPLNDDVRYVQEKATKPTKFTTYTSNLSPSMAVHEVYRTTRFIPDYKRESFTGIKLMPHNFRIEVGRWSSTPADQRVCQCSGEQVQTEQHEQQVDSLSTQKLKLSLAQGSSCCSLRTLLTCWVRTHMSMNYAVLFMKYSTF